MGSVLKDFSGEFGKGMVQMAWKDFDLSSSINKGSDRVNNEIQSILEYYAPRIEGWMKDNAKWTDRTGNARNGLAARAYRQGDEHGIVVYHQVPYGIFLEVRFSGRYGIIIPTLEEWGPRVMEGAKKIFEGVSR